MQFLSQGKKVVYYTSVILSYCISHYKQLIQNFETYFLQKFISKRGLTDHETIHTGEKPFFCHLCPTKVILRIDQSFIKNIVQYRFAVSQKYLPLKL